MAFGIQAQTAPSRLSEQILAVPDALAAAAVDTWQTNPLMSAVDIFQRGQAMRGTSRRVPQAEAKAAVGDLGIEVPKNGLKEDELNLLIKEATRKRHTQQRLEAVPDSFSKTAGVLATSLAVSALDPINVASAFIPVVGEARYASMLKNSESAMSRALLRARVGALEGAVGAAAVEPLVLSGQKSVGADYTMMDSLLNVGIGTALGGVLHSGLGWIKDKAAPAVEAVRSASPDTQEAASKVAIARIAEGKEPKADVVLETDPGFVRVASKEQDGVISESLVDRKKEAGAAVKVLDRQIKALEPEAAKELSVAERKQIKSELKAAEARDQKIEAEIRGIRGKGSKKKKAALQQARRESGLQDRIVALKKKVAEFESVSKDKNRPKAKITKFGQTKAALEEEIRKIDRAQRRIDRNLKPDLDGINVDAQSVDLEVKQSRDQFNERAVNKIRDVAAADDHTMLYDAIKVEASDKAHAELNPETTAESAKTLEDDIMEDVRAAVELAGKTEEFNTYMDGFKGIDAETTRAQKIAEVAAICRVSNG